MYSKVAEKHLSADPILKRLVRTLEPLKLPPSGNVFNELVKAIIFQQISYKAAESIYNRFTLVVGGQEFSPEDLMKVRFDDIRSAGLSNQKSNYVLNIASFFHEKALLHANWDTYSDHQIIEMLTQIKGVGEWTAQMILIFELSREDVFPIKDLGIQIAMKKLYKLEEEKRELMRRMEKISEIWRPHRTLASLYLWAWKRENP